MQLCWNIPRDNGADIASLIPRAPFQRGGHPGYCSDVVTVGCRRRCGISCGSGGACGAFFWQAGATCQSCLRCLSDFVSLIGWVLMAPVSSYAASYGARVAHLLSKRNSKLPLEFF